MIGKGSLMNLTRMKCGQAGFRECAECSRHLAEPIPRR